METYRNNLPTECAETHALLSEYVDNILSARLMWEVEKHITECRACAQECEEMRATVNLLRSSVRFDTDPDFMAKLHARLDALPTENSPIPSAWENFKIWFASGRRHSNYRLPAFGISVAAVTLCTFLSMHRSIPVEPSKNQTINEAKALVTEPLRQTVAFAANDPFEDPVAANLEAHNVLKDNKPDEAHTGIP